MIRVDNLWKCYGSFWALRGLSFEVADGSVYGLIGPNGAGKTTTLRILATCLSPTYGDAELSGLSVTTQAGALRRHIGFLPELFVLYDELRVDEYLDLFIGSFESRVDRRRHTLEDVMQLTDLTQKRDTLLGALSKGWRQRVLLAKSLVHDPRVLLLDEPASGLDPRARVELRSILRTLAQMGKTIIISSHILSELGEVCDAIGVMESGRMVVSGTLDEIRDRCAPTRHVDLVFRDAAGAEDAVRRVLSACEIAGKPRFDGQSVAFRFDGDDDAKAALVASLVKAGVGVVDFHEADHDIEDLFLDVSKGEPS